MKLESRITPLELLESVYQLMLLPTQKDISLSSLRWGFVEHYADSFVFFAV